MVTVEIDVNNDKEMNALFDFETWDEAQAFAYIVIRQGYVVKICGVFDDEE